VEEAAVVASVAVDAVGVGDNAAVDAGVVAAVVTAVVVGASVVVMTLVPLVPVVEEADVVGVVFPQPDHRIEVASSKTDRKAILPWKRNAM